MKTPTDKELQIIVNNVAVDSDGYKFLCILLDHLGAFERGCNTENERKEFYSRGKREQGLWLLDLIAKSNIEIYTKIISERNNENG
ncbi:MAG: hypothetical protein PHV37_09065 [Candidatus Gastranaerophilales bacterium]|nr:hypothetical protein [Candidatus Gastranaerophilales bacterium]